MRKDIKTSCQKRLSRIEGQVRGLAKMVEDDRYCIDIVTQISAVRAALRRLEEEVLRDHVAHCVERAVASGDKADQRQKIAELMDVIGRSDRKLQLNRVGRSTRFSGLFHPGRIARSVMMMPEHVHQRTSQ
jgi:DNA-binding FrmR family transcriptional regulator